MTAANVYLSKQFPKIVFNSFNERNKTILVTKTLLKVLIISIDSTTSYKVILNTSKENSTNLYSLTYLYFST